MTPPNDSLKHDLQQLYNNQLDEAEAHNAARTLVDFMEILLEIHQQQEAPHA